MIFQACFERSTLVLMWRFMAVDWAARTSPSSSAPLKFLVSAASSLTLTSVASRLKSRILAVWMLRIWTRPCSSGRPEKRGHGPQKHEQTKTYHYDQKAGRGTACCMLEQISYQSPFSPPICQVSTGHHQSDQACLSFLRMKT